MAKNPRINRNGLMPSIRHVAINILNRDSAEVDNPPEKKLQNEFIMCRYCVICII